MAENIEMIRPINLPQSQEVYDNDIFVIDSETGGVRKIPKDKVMTKIDDTLTETGQAADAKTVGDELNNINDTLDENIPLIQNPTKTVSGSIAHFTDGADMPAESVVVNIEPVQSGTGTPSPDNVRQISGWESVVTSVAGGNLIDVSTNQSGAIDGSGNEVENPVFNRTDFIPIDKAMVYVKTSAASGYAIRVHGYSSSKAWVQQLKLIATSGTTLLVGETVPNNVAYVRMSYPTVGVDSTELWQADSTTTALGRTVYGGTLDVVSGVLTVDRAMVDLGTLSWVYVPTSGQERFLTSGIRNTVAKPINPSTSVNAVASQYEVTSLYGALEADNTLAVYPDGDMIVRDTRYTSAVDFKTAMSGVQLVYELVTPQTYTLTPTQISTLLGENNVWADAGAVEVTYRKDINIVIDELTNAIVSLGSNV